MIGGLFGLETVFIALIRLNMIHRSVESFLQRITAEVVPRSVEKGEDGGSGRMIVRLVYVGRQGLVHRGRAARRRAVALGAGSL